MPELGGTDKDSWDTEDGWDKDGWGTEGPGSSIGSDMVEWVKDVLKYLCM